MTDGLIGRRVTLRGLPHVAGTVVAHSIQYQLVSVFWDDENCGLDTAYYEVDLTIMDAPRDQNQSDFALVPMSKADAVLRANAVVDAEWSNFRLNVHDYNELRQAILEYALA